jgi:zinc transport system ATP-binding protein
MTTQNAIDIADVSLAYGQVPVLEHIRLQIVAGEFFGLIGPNGAGKTSLLRLILGLGRPDSGSITVLGEDPIKARSRIGYVPQHPTFRRDFPITVTEVIRLGQLGSYWSAPVLADKLLAVMAALELETLANRQIGTLSGGQLQRVLIARALACEPELLILDEPTANIDLRVEQNIFSLLRQYNERMTIIVVSHDVGFISGFVHRAGCLNRTLVCHRTEDISGKTIEQLYGSPVRMINHHH